MGNILSNFNDLSFKFDINTRRNKYASRKATKPSRFVSSLFALTVDINVWLLYALRDTLLDILLLVLAVLLTASFVSRRWARELIERRLSDTKISKSCFFDWHRSKIIRTKLERGTKKRPSAEYHTHEINRLFDRVEYHFKSSKKNIGNEEVCNKGKHSEVPVINKSWCLSKDNFRQDVLQRKFGNKVHFIFVKNSCNPLLPVDKYLEKGIAV